MKTNHGMCPKCGLSRYGHVPGPTLGIPSEKIARETYFALLRQTTKVQKNAIAYGAGFHSCRPLCTGPGSRH